MRVSDLIPHQGCMCLLDEVVAWDAGTIRCRARSHLDPANPLRRDGQLASVCGIEYTLQAAALHGALCHAGAAQPAGYFAALRRAEFRVTRLDDPAFGALEVEAILQRQDESGLVYDFALRAEQGALLLQGRATVMYPRVAPA